MSTLLTKSEAASKLGVSPSVVTRLINSGQIETEVVGKRNVIIADSIAEYMKRANIIASPSDKVRDDYSLPKFTYLSFFSGAGGLDLGLENEGFESVFFCENYKEARMTISKNRPKPGLAGDISSLSAEDVRRIAGVEDKEIDLIAGGPPCQAFSTAGARRAFDDPRGNVFLKFLELANELRPNYLVIENVRGLLSTPYPIRRGSTPVKGGALALILKKLAEYGFSATFNLYNAANFGSAQNRERVVLIAKRDGTSAPWLTPTHSNDEYWQKEFDLKPWKTFGDISRAFPDDMAHDHTQFPDRRLKFFRMLSEGECWTSLPVDLQREAMGKSYSLPGGKTGFYRRISSARPCPTLVTSPTMPATDLCHPTELRPLSIQEYKAVQGFPADWWIAGSIGDVYRQVGNAVPVELGEAIGRTIRHDMSGIRDNFPFERFPYSRYKNTNQNSWKIPDYK